MIKMLPVYIISGIAATAALYSGLTGQKLMWISSGRSAVIVLTAAGILMCTFGVLEIFLTKAPLHPLSIAGYVLGSIALFAGIVQIFKFQIPYLSDPNKALIIIASIIIIKFVIARLSYMLSAN